MEAPQHALQSFISILPKPESTSQLTLRLVEASIRASLAEAAQSLISPGASLSNSAQWHLLNHVKAWLKMSTAGGGPDKMVVAVGTRAWDDQSKPMSETRRHS